MGRRTTMQRPLRYIRRESPAGVRSLEAGLKAATVLALPEQAPEREDTSPVVAKYACDACSLPKSTARKATPESAARKTLRSAACPAKYFRIDAPLEIRRPSRGFLIHSFTLNSGIIGTLLHYRKEPSWHCRPAPAGKLSGSSRNSADPPLAKLTSRARSFVPRAARWSAPARRAAISAARTCDSEWPQPAARSVG